MVPNTLQASVCDEQLMSIGGEIALSGTKTEKMKKSRKNEKKHFFLKKKTSKKSVFQNIF